MRMKNRRSQLSWRVHPPRKKGKQEDTDRAFDFLCARKGQREFKAANWRAKTGQASIWGLKRRTPRNAAADEHHDGPFAATAKVGNNDKKCVSLRGKSVFSFCLYISVFTTWKRKLLVGFRKPLCLADCCLSNKNEGGLGRKKEERLQINYERKAKLCCVACLVLQWVLSLLVFL